MKKALAILLIVCLLSVLACAGPSANSTTSTPSTSTSSSANAPAANNTGTTDAAVNAPAPATQTVNGMEIGAKVKVADPKYNDMTMDELYQEALKEGGTIVAYSITGKITKIAAAFMEEYPGLTVEPYEVSTSDMLTKVPTEKEAGIANADVIIMSDSSGEVYFDWYDKEYVEAYYPSGITKHLNAEDCYFAMPLYCVMDIWYYNCQQYPNQAPINNWWDLLDENEDGTPKYDLYIQDAVSGATPLGLFTQLTLDSDKLLEAYKAKTGKDLEFTYTDAETLGIEPNNAGYEFIYRLLNHKSLNMLDDGDDRVLAVHNNPNAVAIATGSKRTVDKDNGWESMEWVVQGTPYACYLRPTYLYLTPQTDNPAGARLLAYYAMGGDDPTNSKGLAKVLTYGSWTQRDDYEDKKNDYLITDINYGNYDLAGIYNHYLELSDTWIYWKDKAK